ncbi:PSD1 and planctomycete cytochrome C domain-containing protein [Planctomyces sp. SH-PL62]|uniref:PSD1 and planctomycete cytochrome C domain-containing protein n=1 Tax=Planctomyces sp. SH-PL62 TaxID=1636152 RepID=UPI00078D9A5E|nr:PSD1 and planctomycete cytochrome C domain-containing protein [Planctomyces sp. SH-PL62]AMV37768.1 Planctomycete cytochrome C [Planctomyces sp. SH-PL62]
MGDVSRIWAGRVLALGIAAALASIGATARAGEGDATDLRAEAERVRLFEQEVRPLLIAKCQSCHGAEKQKGGLRLDSREALLRGGETGAVVEPGKPAESPLVEAVRYEGLEMPPSGRLEDAEVAALVRWVEAGAFWPGGEAESTAEAPRPAVEKADASFWSFQPLQDVAPPDPGAVAGSPWEGWARNPIDGFVLKGLLDAGLTPAPEAGKTALIRRLTFDLHGLPPTPEEVDAFLADEADDAFEQLVDRLLASPRYGERWGRHWLDVVRYAESDGHNADSYRPDAYRYRDYVVRSFDEDKPYDRFLAEQLAGDELAPGDPDAAIATGFLRLGPYENNQRNVRGQWSDILNEITDVVGEAFLGLSVGCARCHDHKFDPIAQADYYRLQAFFTPILPIDDLPLATPARTAEHDAKLAAWERATADVRAKLAGVEKPARDRLERDIVAKFTPDLQAMLFRPDAEMSPYDRQIKALAYRQVALEHTRVTEATIAPGDRPRWKELTAELKTFDAIKPAPLPVALGVRDVGAEAPPTAIPGGRKAPTPVEPGFPSVLDPSPAAIPPVAVAPDSTGRRLALAAWMNRPDNPLTTRVVVNRAWQDHFGRGLVATSNDFGKLGEAPSHPELLDWLARRFVADGRRFKALNRLIVTSAAYRQSTFRPESEVEEARLIDPADRLLWKRPVMRLEAEEIRDAMLAVSGELAPARGGPAVDATTPRRSIDCKVVRNRRDPILDAFDAPDGFNSTGLRNTTTTVTQTLQMINGPWTLARAKAFAARLDRLTADVKEQGEARDSARIALAYRLTAGRDPDDDEKAAGLAFLDRPDEAEALVDYCHVLLNSSEFLYVD